MPKLSPRPGSVWTLFQIEKELELLDSPCLEFYHDEKSCVIQTSHLTSDELLSVPGFYRSKWRYRYTTDEWIPIFNFIDINDDINQYVDITDDINDIGEYWVTPKGFPRKQWGEE